MKRIVTALEGMDNLKFGMSIEDVRGLMSGKFRTFDERDNREGLDQKSVMDAYDDQGVYCLYGPEGRLEAISLFSPARPLLGGVDILAMRMSQAIALLEKMDPALEINSEGAISSRLSLGVTEATDADEGEDALAENFFFGRAGYYA